MMIGTSFKGELKNTQVCLFNIVFKDSCFSKFKELWTQDCHDKH